MELWTPPHDAPHLLEWWRPLMLASQRARRDEVPWPIHLDEFRLFGRVVRAGRPDIWIYEHPANGGGLYVDATGTTYKFIPTPRAKSIGRFAPCEIRSAVWRAGLPDVVRPIWYREPRRGPWDYVGAVDDDADDDAELKKVSGGVGEPVPVATRGHLTVFDGGA